MHDGREKGTKVVKNGEYYIPSVPGEPEKRITWKYKTK